MATVLGAQLKNMGVPLGKVADKTKGLIKTGADLSAQFGGTAAQAVEALGSALRGETDPIEKYGISIKQADIAARMAADGTDKLEGTQAKQAKTAALLALVTEQSADAHGAFARESDTAAGQAQRTSAKMEDMQAALGTALLPAITVVVEALGKLFAWMEKNQTVTSILIGVIGGIAAAIVVMNAALAVTALLSAPIALVALAIVAIGVALVVAYKKVSWFRNFVDASFTLIKTVIGAVARFLVTAWQSAVDAVKGAIKGVQTGWDTVTGAVKTAVTTVTNWLETKWRNAVDAVKTIIKGVENKWDDAVTAIRNAVTEVTGFLETKWRNAVETVKGIISGLESKAGEVLNGVKSKIGQVWETFRTLGTKIQGMLAGAGTWLFSIGADIIRGLLNGISSMAGSLLNKAHELANKVTDAFKGAFKSHSPSRVMVDIGKDVMGGLKKGMEDGLAGVKAISEAVAETVSATMEKKFKSDKKARQASQSVIKAASDETAALEANARKRQKVYKDLADAREKLVAIQDERKAYADGITNAALAFGAISNLSDKEQTTAEGILADMRSRVEATQNFQHLIETLAAAGLSPQAVRDLANAGVEGGAAIAEGLAAGGPAAIAEANALQASLDAASAALGTNTATSLYDAMQVAQQGIVDGLEIKQETLDGWAETLATNLAKALKKAIRKAVKGAGGGGGGGNGSDTLSLVPALTGSTVAPAVANPRALGAGRTVTGPTVVVNGAIDPEATARQIRRILAGHDRRMGLTG